MASERETLERLAIGLETNSRLAQSLLFELKETEKEFASVKTELNILHENVKALSRIVREGDGEASLLTKTALIEARLASMGKLEDRIDNISDRFIILEKDFNTVKHDAEAEKRKSLDSINKEMQLAHEQKISATKVAEEKQKTIVKIVGTVILGLVTFLSGWLANHK